MAMFRINSLSDNEFMTPMTLEALERKAALAEDFYANTKVDGRYLEVILYSNDPVPKYIFDGNVINRQKALDLLK